MGSEEREQADLFVVPQQQSPANRPEDIPEIDAGEADTNFAPVGQGKLRAKRSEIEVGGCYTAKVAGKLTTVKIVTDHGCRSTYSSIGFYRDTRITEKHGGWEAINLNTKHY